MEQRPDPDELLKQVQSEEQAAKRGKLKVFLGYAAGVGKTYAMLEAARQRKAEGVDVVVALIETHKRVDTEAMLHHLEVLPRKSMEYRGVQLTELDVDAVLKRRPQIALVDELAHTNAPGSIHPKRYLDVEDLLAAGIDVYTTLNIQHIESLNDIVAQITEVSVRETIPDWVVDEAAEIEVIDLPPDELLKRLQEGKVYVPEQAARAVKMFFRKGNLTALREMSLRRAAERVEEQMQTYMQREAISGPWAAGEKLMVCIGPGVLSERLVRSAKRLANQLNCEWLAVHVEALDSAHLSEQEKERVARTLQRAEELGARTVTLPGSPVHRVLLEYARQQNVTRIIVGKSLQPMWQDLFFGSDVNRLLHESGHIDVFVITGEEEKQSPASTTEFIPHRPLGRYLLSTLLVFIATALSFLIRGYVTPTNLVMVYLLAVVISAINLGRGPSILASLLSVLAFDFIFVPPYYTFVVSDTEYIITFIGLFAVGLVISQLAARVRDQMESVQRRQAETASLYGLSRDLASAEALDTILQAIINNIAQTFDREVVIFLPGANSKLMPHAVSSDFIPGENEQAVAELAFKRGEAAGRGTDTLPAADARYLPLKTSRATVGVLAVRPRDPARHLPPERYRLLEAFASQAALAIERVQFAEQARQAQLLQATEKLQTALLNSISHDLRTPLVSITGALTSLDEQPENLDDENRKSLIVTAREEAYRLNRLVGNLLSMTRIESGAIKLHIEPGDIQDLIGTALEQLGRRIANRKVQVDVPDDFPLVPIDFTLMVQVLVNVLENAVKYSPEYCSIEVSADLVDDKARVKIADRGEGIPLEDLSRVFDKFYRVQRPDSVSGTGLGLSISKGIVEAHNGNIQAISRDGGGTIIQIELPLKSKE